MFQQNQNLTLIVKMALGFLDVVMLNVMYVVVSWIFEHSGTIVAINDYYYLWILANCVWLSCAIIFRLYEAASDEVFVNYITKTTHTFLFFILALLTYLYFSRQVAISRAFVIYFLLSFPFGLILNRIVCFWTWTHFRNRGNLSKRIMIIGYNDIGKKLANIFEGDQSQIKMIGYCEDFENVNELSNYPILNEVNKAIATSQELNITDIYSTILPEQDYRIYELMSNADQNCIRFKLVPDLSLFIKRPVHIHYISDLPVLSARKEPLDDIVNRLRKRIFDIVFAIFVIVFILSWLLPIISLAIWLESRGPILFVQKRSGQNNLSFDCIKFRSMKVNLDSNQRQASRDDDRFTRVGKFLRKTNLDEFPQFINVLLGNMSIVGPRPHMIKHTEDYSALIQKYMVRQFLKPGITGWAQVNGYRGETKRIEDMEDRVNHDIWYMEKWSMQLDAKIILLTIYNVFKGEKNAF